MLNTSYIMAKDNTIAIITHVFGLFTWFIGALIVYLATEDKQTKEHAKKALNWQFSLLIYGFISLILILLLVGFILLPILGLLNLIFCVIAAIKAADGKLWDYPLAIKFFK